VVEFVGAYAKDGTIAVLAWFKQFDFPDRAINEF
jgi:hypothetical protein